jgi:hypothetical protein
VSGKWRPSSNSRNITPRLAMVAIAFALVTNCRFTAFKATPSNRYPTIGLVRAILLTTAAKIANASRIRTGPSAVRIVLSTYSPSAGI